MAKKYKRHIISAVVTFLSAFLTTFAFLFEQANGEITRAVVLSAIMGATLAGVRAVVKFLNEKFIKA